ncbi:MAG TPA: efflux RND transporter permease subunit [Chitinispirillaceae bacterium]|nr:efflux RND transporter permease subunit [Chitinispirillaceae bacterium]
MKLSSFSIKRKITMAMIYIIIVGFGLFSLTQLKVAMTPDLTFPVVLVMTSYNGASPQDIENLVTRTVEEGVSATENVKTISSQSSNGVSMVTLEFDWGTDMDKAENDVRTNLDRLRDYLPDDAEEPIVLALNPSMMPIMMMSMNAKNLSPAVLRTLGDDKVSPLLERVKGVASVSIEGGLKRRINVKLDPVLLASHGLSPSTISAAIQSSAGLVAAGNIRTDVKEYNLRIYSEYRTVDQISSIMVKSGTVPVRLKDIATVEDGFEEQTSDVRVNGGQGVAVVINKQSDANTVQTAQAIRKALPGIKKVLPPGVEFTTIFDTAEFTEKSVDNLSSTAMMSFIIVVFVIYLFLRNWRSSLIMAVSMPISIITTFGVLYLSNLTLNVISMAGLALAIGMLVDNSIVVLENIFRHRDLGHENMDVAADVGTSEMGTPIIASTLTTIAVFVPVLFVPGITGQLFREMVLTITFSLSISLLVALTIVPMMSAVLLKKKNKEKDKKENAVIAKKTASNVFIKGYRSLLHWSIYHKKSVLVIVGLMFVGSLALLPMIGGEFMPESDEGRINMTVECASGTPLTQMRKIVLDIEESLKSDLPEITTKLFQFGASSGFNPNSSKSNSITITIKLVPLNERNRSQKQIETIIRKRFDQIAGINYSIRGGGMMGSGESAIELKLIGDNLTKIKSVADDIKARMEKVNGMVDIKLNVSDYVPQLDVHLKQDVLNDFNLSGLQVASVVSTAIQGRTAAQLRESGDEYDIYVQLDKKYRRDRDALGNVLITLPSGGTVPLREISDIVESRSPVTIYRENQERYISVSCNLSGLDLSSARKEVERIQSEIVLPSDMMIVVGGNAEDQKESNFYLLIAFVVAIVLVYMVMASQFESLLDPFIIMFTVPLSLIGVFVMLFLTHTPLSVMALVGVVMLVGIAVNNGIVLVDYMNQQRHNGVQLYNAAEESGIVRLRPVLMTALTTIIGMIPMALGIGDGSETWAPLARVVIGGLFTTTVLTLVFIPVTYIIFEEWSDKFNSFFFGKS